MQTTALATLPDLAAAAQAGDPAARDQLFEALRPIVAKTARSIIGPGVWVAEDAIQETLLDIANSLDGLGDPSKISSWAKTVTANRTQKVIAREKAHGAEPLDRDLLDRITVGLTPAEEVELIEAFRTLPARQRAVTYFRAEGHSVKEVAEMLGCAEGTVKACYHHGRARLEAELRRRGLTPDRFE
ncbi:MAG: sigma-70 family RNA polymerase sigma factor [Actinobacteria bacterium]|nr:MAG: sigma-70 family RNA polymerase sigma factor [Actinomycetota bacterium]